MRSSHEFLKVALRVLIVKHQVRSIKAGDPDVDVSVIESLILRIRTSLKRISAIKRKTTDINGLTTDINSEADTIRNEIREALLVLEDVIRCIDADDHAEAA